MLTIIENIQHLAKQGQPLRGDGKEEYSNFNQLLLLRGKDNPNIHEWCQRKNDTYTSKEIQNEIIKLMSLKLLRKISSDVQQSAFYTVMADETTDASNKEQLVIVFRWVDNDLTIYEDFAGLYMLEHTDAVSIYKAVKDVILALNLDIHKMRGQCYDGAAAMSGKRNGVAKRLIDDEPRAIYTHCYSHALNLAVGDTIKGCRLTKNALDTAFEISKLIKYSPKRDAMFHKLKEDMQPELPGIKVFCPTRWTVRAESLRSILDNYMVLLELWDLVDEETKDSEIRARVGGVASQMKKFEFFFGITIAEILLRHTDNLSRTLQKKDLSAVEGQHVAALVKQTLQSMRDEALFSNYWKSITAKAKEMDVSEPGLPRGRKRPRRYEDGEASAEFHSTPEEYYRVYYYEVLDLMIQCLTDRFDQPGYKMFSTMEQLLLKGCQGKAYEGELKAVMEMYHEDINENSLVVQFKTFSLQLKDQNITFKQIYDHLKKESQAARSLYSEIVILVKLILAIPATNASSERSFSALRRIKTYLRSSMTQLRLNNLMVLYVHRERLEQLNLEDIGNEFIDVNEHRQAIFGHFN